MKKIFTLICLVILISACSKQEIKKSGKINFELVVYNNISKTIDSKELIPNIYPISSLYFYKDKFLEVIPPHNTAGTIYQIISNDTYYTFGDLLKIPEHPKLNELKEKKYGIKFNVDSIPEGKIIPMADTSFNDFQYKRISINNKENYTIFYFHKTDTLYPYSLNRSLEKKYKGWLNRVDTYDYKKDEFSSLRLVQNDTVPKTIFHVLNSLK